MTDLPLQEHRSFDGQNFLRTKDGQKRVLAQTFEHPQGSKGPGHPGEIPGTSQVLSLKTQGKHKLSREGANF